MVDKDELYSLKPNDIIIYKDNNGLERKLKFIKNTGLVKSIKGQGEALQQQFEDERGNILHVPVNAWDFLENNYED